ncbi:TRAP transporter large permease subunit [Thalassospira sp. MCCC 1A01428]|uniref:TRAP transporter large permease subunit n=1 Tax=Thalassospira sp. MCCC 1A01428 TaxID=1470575 RepID=UPI000A1D87DC|nr:TRAP transporter large permease subunit [Thalassospira sp. MCCC 1A01428]
MSDAAASQSRDYEEHSLDGYENKAQTRSGIIDHLSRYSGISISVLIVVAAFATLWEVGSRYILHAPTDWAFEVVMTLIAASWMFSAGYITLNKGHIRISVLSDIAPPRIQQCLEIFGMVVGILALFLLLSDASFRAYGAIAKLDRTGSAFNSPLPTLTSAFLALGAALYLMQLMVNLHQSLASGIGKSLVKFVALLMAVYFVAGLGVAIFGDTSPFAIITEFASNIGKALDPSKALALRKVDLGTLSIIMVLMLISLMMTGMPLGIVTLFVSVIIAIGFFGPRGLYLVSTNAAGMLEHYTLVAVPFFVLMAAILERSGVAEDLFDAMSVLAGNLRGGVAIQTVVVAVILAAMSGVMGGEIVMLGLVALPQMMRLGYDRKLSIGLICASGALATLIPPSIIMIVYGLSAEVGIGQLFIGGIVPGVLLAFCYAAYVFIRVNLNPKLAPTAAEAVQNGLVPVRKLGRQKLISVAMAVILIFCVMGSIYGGIASVTESAAVGVVGALLIAFLRGRLFRTSLLGDTLVSTMSMVGTIMWLILGAISFVGIFNLVGGGDYLREMFLDLGLPALGIVIAMMAVLLVLGTFMEWIAIVLITVPVFAPVVVALAPDLGLSPTEAKLWFGILFVLNIQIYFLSPPFGPACFWLKSVAQKEITLQQIFASVLPFIAIQFVVLCLFIAFPDLVLWLPDLLSH